MKGKYLEKGTLIVVQLQEIARAHEAGTNGRESKEESEGIYTKTTRQTTVFSLWKSWTLCKGSKSPAKGKKCDLCSKTGHFRVVCRSKGASQKDRLNVIDIDGDDEFAFGVTVKKKPEQVNIVTGGVETTAMIDSGTSCNIVVKNTWGEMKKKKIKCTSSKATGDVCMPLGMKNH